MQHRGGGFDGREARQAEGSSWAGIAWRVAKWVNCIRRLRKNGRVGPLARKSFEGGVDRQIKALPTIIAVSSFAMEGDEKKGKGRRVR